MQDDKKHIVALTALIKDQSQERFLILKRSEKEVAYPGKWSLPGGKLEKGESFLDTLKREVKEETGLDIEDDKEYLKDFTFVRPDGHNVVGLCFLVKAKSEEVTLTSDHDAYLWIRPEELGNYDYIKGTEEEVRLAFKQASLHEF